MWFVLQVALAVFIGVYLLPMGMGRLFAARRPTAAWLLALSPFLVYGLLWLIGLR